MFCPGVKLRYPSSFMVIGSIRGELALHKSVSHLITVSPNPWSFSDQEMLQPVQNPKVEAILKGRLILLVE